MLRRFSTVPWYVKAVKKPVVAKPVNQTVLEKIISASKEFGLKDIEVIERNRASSPEKLVVGTGRNVKHLAAASLQLKTWLKHELNSYTLREGVFTVNKLRVEQRRAARKLKSKRLLNGDQGAENKFQPPKWVAIDTKIENISVHMMTEDRRLEIDFNEMEEENEKDLDNLDDELGKFNSDFPAGKVFVKTEPADWEKYGDESANVNEDEMNKGNANKDEVIGQLNASDQGNQIPVAKSPVNGTVLIKTRGKAGVREFHSLAQESRKEGRKEVDFAKLEEVKDLCYLHQDRFCALEPTSETCAEFVAECDKKSEQLLQIYIDKMLPRNESIIFNKNLLVLLYRMHVCPSIDTFSNEQVLARPKHEKELRSFNHPCSGVIRDMLISTNCLNDIKVAALLLGSLAHANQFDSFWRVRYLAELSAPNQEQIQLINELAVALAVKSGKKNQIETAVSFVNIHASPVYDSAQFYASDRIRLAMDSII